jgi:hypothetical protein
LIGRLLRRDRCVHLSSLPSPLLLSRTDRAGETLGEPRLQHKPAWARLLS